MRGRPRAWATARQGDREQDGDGDWGRSRDWEGEWEYLCGMIARLRGRSWDWEEEWEYLCGNSFRLREGDSEIERGR